MTDEIFANALQQSTAGTLPLTGLIEAAALLSREGQADLARQLYQAWILHNQSHPQLYVAYFNCAAMDSEAKDKAAAAIALEKSIALNPEFVPAYINLGRLHEEAGKIENAIELWQVAANCSAPLNSSAIHYATTALTQMARVLSQAQQSERAEDAIRRCLDINPRQPEMVEQYTALRLAQCKWPVAMASEQLDRKTLISGINPLSMAAYTDDPLLQLASAYAYVKRASWDGPKDDPSDRRHAEIDLGNRRLRVGYISSDLRDHAIGYLMSELFELHDWNTIEVFAYYCGTPSNSPLTQRIQSAVEHWIDIRDMSDAEAAARIAADGIDILVDVNGHTRDSKTGVFARRPAPIQVNWLGYPGSMGTPYHQYIIADDWIIPAGSELYYSEKVARLPCYQPNDRKRGIAAEPPSRAAAGLPDDAFVFCCFNSSHKISRFTFERWMEILGRTPGSVLWLLDAPAQAKATLDDLAEQRGIARDRLVFAAKMPNPQHLARYPLADLFLDSAPYGAHTTASDALWMGVPVLTLSGRSFASRVCGSLVRAAGVGDLVCTSHEEYVERAIALAHNPAAIQDYKQTLRANRDSCTLFDTNLLAGKLEQIYRTMCDEHRAGLIPQPDLANLEAYLDAGIEHDHDSVEVLRIADYHELYRTKLKRFHLARSLTIDSRLWRGEDIAAADKREVAATDEPTRTLNQLETLLALKARGASAEQQMEGLRTVMDAALRCFNQAAAEGHVEQAARYADALAALMPGNVAALNSALSCSVALGRADSASQYAATITAIDPSHAAALAVLAKHAAAAAPEEALHPLIQLRDLYDQASSILCSPLTEPGLRQVGELVAAARKLEFEVPANAEWAGWEKHYRLALQAIDMPHASGSAPRRDGKIVFAAASGKALDWAGVRAAAKSLRAKAVFFAAADQTYLDLYGRAYIESILDHADVSSLIVLHVIGGAKTLPRIAKSLGIASNRLILAGDTFDAGSIKTRCYDAPPKGLSTLPIAHLQSVRFLRAGALLRNLNLPVLVSDIDLILQRGVADLLQQFETSDIVLNENTLSNNAGSRFTANLLLLNPTPDARLFLDLVSSYLTEALSGSEVTRWIDQFALMQARHRLTQQRPGARIGYFDVETDINNLIYKRYQEHPYRFLSLYHGFDMSTLPRKSKPRAASSTRKKKAARAPARRARLSATG